MKAAERLRAAIKGSARLPQAVARKCSKCGAPAGKPCAAECKGHEAGKAGATDDAARRGDA